MLHVDKKEEETPKVPCRACNGCGIREDLTPRAHGCPYCKGKGKVDAPRWLCPPDWSF